MTNPFFSPSTLPYGLPPFAEITDEDYRPAFDKGLEDHLAEIAAVADNPDAPTFDNTMIPLEKGGQVLQRVAEVFFNKSSADSNDFTNQLEEELAPLLAAHQDAIRLNPKFARAYHDRGWARAGTKRLREAIDDFDKSIELNPAAAAQSYLGRALTRSELGEQDQAFEDFLICQVAVWRYRNLKR